jgi:hypothetical protein
VGTCLLCGLLGRGRSTGDYTEQGHHRQDFQVVQFSATSLAILVLLSYQMADIQVKLNMDGFVKSPHAALLFKTRHCDVPKSTPHSSFLARLASGAFYEPVCFLRFYEFVKYGKFVKKQDLPQSTQSQSTLILFVANRFF